MEEVKKRRERRERGSKRPWTRSVSISSLWIKFWIRHQHIPNLSDILMLTDTQAVLTIQMRLSLVIPSPLVPRRRAHPQPPRLSSAPLSQREQLAYISMFEASEPSCWPTVCCCHGRLRRGIGTSRWVSPCLPRGQRAAAEMLTCHRYAYYVA